MDKIRFNTVEEYFSALPADVRPRLEELRSAIKEAAPEAQEIISYGMPAFEYNGILVYYAAWKQHLGFYPASAIQEAFRDDLADFKTSKGAIQFPLDRNLPLDLIKKITEFRVNENLQKARLRALKKKRK